MSDQTGLTPELKNLESHLLGVQLPGSKFDRDETLYQSGWAAAMAQAQSTKTVATARWMWPASSGVLATLAAVLAVMLVLKTGVDDRGGQTGLAQTEITTETPDDGPNREHQAAAKDEGVRPAEQHKAPPIGPDLMRLVDNLGGPLLSSSLLARIQSPRRQMDSTGMPAPVSTYTESFERPVTNRQLMNQLLLPRENRL